MPNLKLVGTKKDNMIPFISPAVSNCGCGSPAEYEVYEGKDRQPHCRGCMLEAVDNRMFITVRKIGGYDDAS
ncbi:hypothetical protein MKZ12_07090 [Paenibacillus sp. FSL R5-0713]|uniref:hypothetical protein n=1 Tax=Paenibacillus sp. FSL R5-0713 TaxID=2921655 RepID=UPI0030D98035